MLLNILQRMGHLPTTKTYPAQNVNSAKVEKLWFNHEAMRSHREILNQKWERFDFVNSDSRVRGGLEEGNPGDSIIQDFFPFVPGNQ